MPRRLSLDTMILLDCLLDAARDAAELLLHPTVGRFTSGSSWSDENLECKLRQLAARGVIELPQPADARIVRITEAGRHLALGGVDPEARWSREWDGAWHMVLFDVAEAERKVRDNLRRTLSLARLGYLQGSVWVSPDPLAQLRDTVRTIAASPESLLFFEGHPSAGESNTSIVEGAWNFRRINGAYHDTMALHNAMPRPADPPHRWRQWLREERQTWFEALDADPLLPHSLLPSGYLGQKAFRSHREALGKVARRLLAAS